MISTRSRNIVSAAANTPAAITQINQTGTPSSWHESLCSRRTRPLRIGRGDEVDQLLDGAQQGHLDVGEAVDAREHLPPHLPGIRHAQRRTDAVLPVRGARHVRPAFDAESRRLHRLPDVHVRMPGDADRFAPARGAQPLDDAALLAVRDEMVDEHADATRRPRSERVQLLVEVVDAVDRLDDDALDAQVVAPDAFEQRRVVDASTQIRLACATLARATGAANEPDAVRARSCLRAAATGRTRVTGRPSSRKAAGSSGKSRRRPWRFSSVTVSRRSPASTACPSATTAPQNLPSAVSTTSSASAATSGTVRRRGLSASTSAL